MRHDKRPGRWRGLVYGLRALAPWRRDRGHSYDPNKVLLDLWARAIVGTFFNAGDTDADVRLPAGEWITELDRSASGHRDGERATGDGVVALPSRSLTVLIGRSVGE